MSYEKRERFDIHHDWYEEPQAIKDERGGRWFNRVSGFFVYLEGEGEGVARRGFRILQSLGRERENGGIMRREA